jgi:hypothetical protein
MTKEQAKGFYASGDLWPPVARRNEIDDSDAMCAIALSLNAITKEMRAIAIAIEKLAKATADNKT